MRALSWSQAAVFGGLFLFLSLAEAKAYSSMGWKHAETAHFTLSYTDATEKWLQQAGRIAEDTRDSLIRYFNDDRDFRSISIILSDDSDEPNGASLQADPVVIIDCRKTQSLFRGESDWLRTVLTHELSHQYSLQLLKTPVRINWVQELSSSAENFSLSYQRTTSVIDLPQWFVEGMAQMGSRHVEADSHDPVRRMVLGDAYRNGRLLTLEEMGRFEGTSRDQELVYNQGFAFLIYLETTYSEAKLAALCTSIRTKGFIASFPVAMGKTLQELYNEWKASLEQEYRQKNSIAGTRLFKKNGPMVIETASDTGSFVIANWDNDFTRFSLFRKSRDGYTSVARDTGPTLRTDAGGGAWFTQLTYNADAGVSTYELFHLHRNGHISMETRGSRVAAFDVKDGHVAYARYGKPGTEIVVRKPDGSESILGIAPTGTGVYSIVLLSPGSALVSLGTGDRVCLAVLDGGWKLLWPEQEAMDVVSIGGDRVVFSSTLDGSPQLYWADLARNAMRWYRITDAAGGARFPVWDATEEKLTYSEYSNGSWLRCEVDRELSVERTADIPSPLFGTVVLKPEVDPFAEPVVFNNVFHAEPLTLGWLGQRVSAGNNTVSTAEAILLGWQVSYYSAPSDWRLLGSISVLQDLNSSARPTTDLQIGGLFSLGATRNTISYELLSESIPGAYYTIESLTHSSSLSSQFQIASDQIVGADFGLQLSEDVTPLLQESVVYLVLGDGGVRWSWSDTPHSVFDPAGLGQSGFGAFVEVRVFTPFSLNQQYWNGAIVKLDNLPAEQISGGWGFRSLLLDSKLALGTTVRGLATVGAVEGRLVLPWALESLGGESRFSGYPAGYADIVHMVNAAVSMKTNPLVDKFGRTQWYERLSVGAQIEAGAGMIHFANLGGSGLKFAVPLSAEINLSGSFFEAPDHPSEIVLRFAMELNDFLATEVSPLQLPFQIYASYLY